MPRNLMSLRMVNLALSRSGWRISKSKIKRGYTCEVWLAREKVWRAFAIPINEGEPPISILHDSVDHAYVYAVAKIERGCKYPLTDVNQ